MDIPPEIISAAWTAAGSLATIAATNFVTNAIKVRFDQKTNNRSVTTGEVKKHLDACEKCKAEIISLTDPTHLEEPKLSIEQIIKHKEEMIQARSQLKNLLLRGIGRSEEQNDNTNTIHDTALRLQNTFVGVAYGKAEMSDLIELHDSFDQQMATFIAAIKTYIEQYQLHGNKKKANIFGPLLNGVAARVESYNESKKQRKTPPLAIESGII